MTIGAGDQEPIRLMAFVYCLEERGVLCVENSPYEQVKYNVGGRYVKYLRVWKAFGRVYIHDYIRD